MVTVDGAGHIVRYANPVFCRLAGKASDELVGTSFCAMLPDSGECIAMMDRIARTAQPENYIKLSAEESDPLISCYAMWPVMVDGRAAGIAVQMIETVPLHERTLAMNEALMLGAVRLHEITTDIASRNVQLQAEVSEREQRERDALMLTYEVAHRIKNNLQIIIALISHEARSAGAPCLEGYRTMQARIGAIAELYDLISRTGDGQSIALDAYLREIARTMTDSLLGSTTGIRIEVEAEALEIDSLRAVPFGLLVNELATNAIKHAFPDRTGRVLLSVTLAGDQIELTVADNGVGIKEKYPAQISERHGSDYVAIFLRQIGGVITVSRGEATGTSVRVRLPLLTASNLKGLGG